MNFVLHLLDVRFLGLDIYIPVKEQEEPVRIYSARYAGVWHSTNEAPNTARAKEKCESKEEAEMREILV